MKYEGLARAYRPRAFADVVGQEVTVRTLQQALRTGRAAPATLLAGSRGIGKTTLARLLAKAFVCEQGPTSTPCDACEPCQEIPQGRCLDVMEIDGASHTGVDDVRALRDSVRYGPAKCRCKVFIIDEVHMLSQSAFNALLKTLEEPPPHVRFIFATTEAHKIPATVLSRCQRYDLQRLDVGVIADRLTFVARQEKIDLSAEAVALIAEAAEGSLRDALSLADQVVSFAPDSPTAQDVAAVLGIPDSQCVQQLAAAVLSGDAATALGICSRAAASGMDGQKLLRGFAWRMRHLAVAAAAGSDEQLIPLSEQQRQEVATQAKELDPLDPQRLLAMAIDGVDRVARSLDPWLALELAVLRMVTRPRQADTVGISRAIARLEALTRAVLAGVPQQPSGERSEKEPSRVAPLSVKAEGHMDSRWSLPSVKTGGGNDNKGRCHDAQDDREKRGVPGPISTSAEPPSDNSELTTPTSVTTAMDSAPKTIDPRWAAFVHAMQAENPLLASHLEHGCPVHDESTPKDQLRVTFTSRLHHEMVRHKCDDPSVRQELARHFGAAMRLCPVLAREEGEVGHGSLAQQRQAQKRRQERELRQQAEESPLVQEALKLFGGEIRSVAPVAAETEVP